MARLPGRSARGVLLAVQSPDGVVAPLAHHPQDRLAQLAPGEPDIEAGEQLAVCGRCGGSGLGRAALRVTRRTMRRDPDRLRLTRAAMCGPGLLDGAGLQRGRSSR